MIYVFVSAWRVSNITHETVLNIKCSKMTYKAYSLCIAMQVPNCLDTQLFVWLKNVTNVNKRTWRDASLFHEAHQQVIEFVFLRCTKHETKI